MPRAGAPPWRARREPILDHVIQASIDQAGNGFDPATGRYAEVHYVGCSDYARAKEVKQALYRSARHFKVSLHTEIVRSKDGTFTVKATAINKAHGQAYIAAKANGDPERLAYNPHRKGK